MKKTLALLIGTALLMVLCASALAETFTISLIGDCTVGERYSHRGYKSSYTTKIGELGMDYPFSLAADLFAADDVTVANCEVNLTLRKPRYPLKVMSLSAPPEFAEVFVLGNVDACNITNNHSIDFGAAGREETHDVLTSYGIGAFGEDWTYTMEAKGVKVGFVGYTYPINDGRLAKYKKKIQELRDEGCDLVVASVHWGKEESYQLNGQQKTSGHKLIDLGADIVFGHGPHVLQPIEYYNGRVIFYSTANFTFGANSSPKDPDTAVFQLIYDIAEDGTPVLSRLIALPYCMHKDKDFRPWPYTETADKERVWKKLWRDAKPASNLPESFLNTGEVDFTAPAQ